MHGSPFAINDKEPAKDTKGENKSFTFQNLWATITIPTLIFLVLFVIGCLFFTRNDSICCQVGVRSISLNNAELQPSIQFIDVNLNSRFVTETSKLNKCRTSDTLSISTNDKLYVDVELVEAINVITKCDPHDS